MKKLALGISFALVAILVTGCGGGSSGNGDGSVGGGNGTGGDTGQSGAEQSLCLQRHPLLNAERPTTREEAVAAFYRAKVDCKASLSALLQQAKTMEQNGISLD